MKKNTLPTEIKLLWLDEQERFSGKRDFSVFEKENYAGFNWTASTQGRDFWYMIVEEENYEDFYKMYSKNKAIEELLSIEKLIIKKAIEICRANFMQHPDYDPDIPLGLIDALTIIVAHDTDMESDKVYDTINNLVK